MGRTVFISSHILDEVERVGSNVLVMVDGKLAAEGDFHAIRALMADRPLKVHVTCTETRALAAKVVHFPSTKSVKVDGDQLFVETNAIVEFHRALPLAAQQVRSRADEHRGHDEDLESVFRYLVD